MSNTAQNALALLREQGLTMKQAEMNLAAQAYNKYNEGEGISDEELKAAVKVFGDLEYLLREINDRKLDLFHNRISQDLSNLKNFVQARKELL